MRKWTPKPLLEMWELNQEKFFSTNTHLLSIYVIKNSHVLF